MTHTIRWEQPEKIVVWIVEDNPEFGKQLAALLNLSREFDCSNVFGSCEGALALLSEDTLPDLILMDVGLPGISGLEGIREVKRIAPVVDVVMLTVFEDSETIVRAISAGASGYLLKSSSLEVIVESLKGILNGGAPMSPQIAKRILALYTGRTPPPVEYNLSRREREILQCLVDGLTKKEIAEKLSVSFHTIDHHLRNIYSKLQVQSRSSAVAKALKERLL